MVVSTVLPLPASRGPVAAWREDLGWVLTVVALVLIVAGVVLAVRAGMYRDRYAAQMSMFSRDQRRRARRCVRRGQPAPQEVGAAAVLFAQALVRQRTMVLAYAGMAANTSAIALNATNLGLAAVEAAVVVVILVAVIVVLVQAHGARRWLQTHAIST